MNKVLYASLLVMTFLPASAQAKEKAFTAWEVGQAPMNPLYGIKSHFRTKLMDPYSAEYVIEELYPAYCKKGWLQGGGVGWVGWAANIQINGKNTFGAFTGYQPYTVMFSGDAAVNDVEGTNFGAFGPKKGLLGLDGGAGLCKRIQKEQVSQ